MVNAFMSFLLDGFGLARRRCVDASQHMAPWSSIDAASSNRSREI
jgi:hypothetical protein